MMLATTPVPAFGVKRLTYAKPAIEGAPATPHVTVPGHVTELKKSQ
jgi:hypothetical protein